MVDRVLKVLPGNRYVVQGISDSGGSTFSAVQANAEEFTYKIDFERWLDGSTISTDTLTTTGTATISEVATTTYLTLTISGVSGNASVTILVTAADGRAKELVLGLIEGRANVTPANIVSPESAASRIGYNNTYSDRAATNVQEALDEIPKITVSTSAPSGGNDGDVWFVVPI